MTVRYTQKQKEAKKRIDDRHTNDWKFCVCAQICVLCACIYFLRSSVCTTHRKHRYIVYCARFWYIFTALSVCEFFWYLCSEFLLIIMLLLLLVDYCTNDGMGTLNLELATLHKRLNAFKFICLHRFSNHHFILSHFGVFDSFRETISWYFIWCIRCRMVTMADWKYWILTEKPHFKCSAQKKCRKNRAKETTLKTMKIQKYNVIEHTHTTRYHGWDIQYLVIVPFYLFIESFFIRSCIHISSSTNILNILAYMQR